MFFKLLLTIALCAGLEAAQPTCGTKPHINCKMDECERRLKNLERIKGTHVEFLATGASPKGTEIVFPNVVLNKGGGYDSITGRFTAPVEGMYIFEASLSPSGSSYWQKIQCYILKNVVKTSELFTDKFGANRVGSYPATYTVPLHLKKNDFVNIGRCTNVNNGIRNNARSNFNGFLLYPAF